MLFVVNTNLVTEALSCIGICGDKKTNKKKRDLIEEWDSVLHVFFFFHFVFFFYLKCWTCLKKGTCSGIQTVRTVCLSASLWAQQRPAPSPLSSQSLSTLFPKNATDNLRKLASQFTPPRFLLWCLHVCVFVCEDTQSDLEHSLTTFTGEHKTVWLCWCVWCCVCVELEDSIHSAVTFPSAWLHLQKDFFL